MRPDETKVIAPTQLPTKRIMARFALHLPSRLTISLGAAPNTIHFAETEKSGFLPSPKANPQGHPCSPPPQTGSGFQSGASTVASTSSGHRKPLYVMPSGFTHLTINTSSPPLVH